MQKTLFSSTLLALSLIAGCCPTIIDALPARVIDGLFNNFDDQLSLLQTEVVTKSSAAQPHQDKLEHTAHECRSFSGSETAAAFQVKAIEDEAPNGEVECDSAFGHHMGDKNAHASDRDDWNSHIPEAAMTSDSTTPDLKSRSMASRVVAYIMDFFICLIVFDGICRWRRTHPGKDMGVSEASETVEDVWSGLMQAALQGNVEQCKYYLNMDIDLSKKDIWGCNALHAAAKGGSQAVVRKLLASGLKVDEPDSWDETALHIAARNGHAEVCETLLAFGATLNTRNAQHMTPLLIAGHAGHEAVCRLLVGLGAHTAGVPHHDVPSLLQSFLSAHKFAGADYKCDLDTEFSPLDDDAMFMVDESD